MERKLEIFLFIKQLELIAIQVNHLFVYLLYFWP